MKRAIIPVLGKVELPPLVSELALLPEIQRLRHVSLSNIDSCSLVAIGGVSRYEHSLATAILASHVADRLGLHQNFRAELVIAAGLHDVAAPGLGHLFEEGCMLAEVRYDHERQLSEIILGEGNQYYQVYLGKELGCRRLMHNNGVLPRAVLDAIRGRGRCGPAVSGSIDLDNIDNVARMLFRLGRLVSFDQLKSLAEIFCLAGDEIKVDRTKSSLFVDWLSLRRDLYNTLMPEPTDFAAKSMTKRAISIGLQTESLTVEDWHLTDYELLLKLRGHGPTSSLVERLWLGDYFPVVALYWIEGEHSVDLFKNNSGRLQMERELNLLFGSEIMVDYILDKRERSMDSASPPPTALVGVMSQRRLPRKHERLACDQYFLDRFGDGCQVHHEDVTLAKGAPQLPFTKP